VQVVGYAVVVGVVIGGVPVAVESFLRGGDAGAIIIIGQEVTESVAIAVLRVVRAAITVGIGAFVYRRHAVTVIVGVEHVGNLVRVRIGHGPAVSELFRVQQTVPVRISNCQQRSDAALSG